MTSRTCLGHAWAIRILDFSGGQFRLWSVHWPDVVSSGPMTMGQSQRDVWSQAQAGSCSGMEIRLSTRRNGVEQMGDQPDRRRSLLDQKVRCSYVPSALRPVSHRPTTVVRARGAACEWTRHGLQNCSCGISATPYWLAVHTGRHLFALRGRLGRDARRSCCSLLQREACFAPRSGFRNSRRTRRGCMKSF